MMKEHLITLSLDKKVQEKFDKIDTRIKTNITKTFNKLHRDDTKPVNGKRKNKSDLDDN
jgi:hypothetical protein